MNQDLLKNFKQIKWIQLSVMILASIAFFLIIKLNPAMNKSVYSNTVLFTLCAFVWGILIVSFISLIYDFSRIGSFVKMGHALNKAAYLDNLTGIPNRHSFDKVFKIYDTPEKVADLGCALIQITNLEEINDKIGHDAGDFIIQRFSQTLEKVGDQYGFVGRNGGNEFLAVFEDCTSEKMERFFADLQNQVNMNNNEEHSIAPISFRKTFVLNKDAHVTNINQLITLTYKKSFVQV